MNGESEQTNLSPIKRALLAVEAMQAKLDAMQAAKREPIAILGMGCRFPGGVNHPSAFWDLLHEEVDAISTIPASRWQAEAHYDPDPEVPGKMYTRQGGFLSEIDGFDPQFFGISAREARSLDPQQRLLLEVSWEALENAYQVPETLLNSETGVFIGICSNDYNKKLWQDPSFSQVDAFSATGNALSVAAGRISYTFGLKGPSLAIDTACSSSLVAVHTACQQLRDRECHMALVGGVNLMLAPDSTIAFAKTRMLAPDGRCKPFDASANGYVRGEGCGVIVLKRLSDAIADKNRILAVIRGSGVNHNGRSSSLIAPNGPAQQTAILKAIENSKIDPTQVSYVEVQGTGTVLGEPIEVGALDAVYGKNRSPDHPLLIGSVKTNIGHLEAASGIASLMKVVLAMQHNQIPAHLHFQDPNPHIEWDQLSLQVATKPTVWQRGEQPRLAGVSAFGFSGTNAHLILEDPPLLPEPPNEVERPLHLLTLSAKTESALQQLIKHYHQYLTANPNLNLPDLCFSANVGRSHFSFRLAIIAASVPELQQKLTDVQTKPETSPIAKVASPPKIAFLFPGEGSDYPEMGRQLYETQPTFRQTLDHCSEICQSYWEQPLIEWMYSTGEREFSRPKQACALFALEYGLYRLWQSWGVLPSVIFAEGVGERVAACIADMISVEAALKSIATSSVSEDLNALARTETPPTLPILSSRSLTGAEQNSGTLAQGFERLKQYQIDLFLELGPQPTLSDKGPQYWPEGKQIWLSSLNPIQSDWQQMLQTLSALYDRQVKVNWSGFDQDYARCFVDLPTYPWQRERYWIEDRPVEPPIGSPENGLGLDSTRVDPLIQQLSASGHLTAEEIQLLPKLINLLSHGQEQASTVQPVQLNSVETTVLDQAAIQDWLTNKIAQELGVAPETIDPHQPFDSYGLDSMLALSIASAGQKFLGIEVSPLLLLHYPTIATLSQHLAAEVETSDSEMFEL